MNLFGRRSVMKRTPHEEKQIIHTRWSELVGELFEKGRTIGELAYAFQKKPEEIERTIRYMMTRNKP